MSSPSLRSRNNTTATAREQPMNIKETQNNSSLVNPANAKWLILIILFLTTTIGTYRSFSIYSRDNPDIPIHQLTRIPLSSLLSTHTTDIRSTTTTLPYFANKSNFLNQKFVKLGWAWTTFVVWFHAIAIATCYFGPPHPNQQQQQTQNSRSHPSSHVPRILSLHLLATLLWIFLTQWCFGSSLIERVLILSGAKCIPSLKPFHSSETTPTTPTTLENLYCQHRWGRNLPGLDNFILSTYKPYWSEGIDVSGHVFLLTFSILLIVSSLSPSLIHLWRTTTKKVNNQNNNKEEEKDQQDETVPRNYRLAIYANLGLLFVWWWMLLMTSLYFHGPLEKFSGFVLAGLAWFFVETSVARLLG
ncbi:uncharacterized protein PGTG_12117 [Puccinia graminis f. sp. tritici CRL 75-36-700-3]|uniref:Uncharacterized protein n=1 Tax=Puccinia graminis f. sp. tritici (strain CRL 75-36-700-3 / race SCCL) TaxID=418459 RepID=E3KPD6_PUCGT|nr:uncharacterized protein PGTG_12117 [Puccinia graminis f. sp. tritici CRL 75-36-700-3]EFP86161.1 hypothetical protein PGTG_12117 [Puccinia graminis f. sp. tritici CRL 75-36-700-3]